MKQFTRWILLSALLVLAAASFAFAADAPSADGLYDLTAESYVTLTPDVSKAGTTYTINSVDYDGSTVQKSFYPVAEKLTLSYSNAQGAKYYLALLLKDGESPTKDNIAYIDQSTADSATVSFTLYPYAMSAGTYNVYLSSNADTGNVTGYTKVGSFKYYQAWMRGDANGDRKITAPDATRVLQHVGGVSGKILTGTGLLAADANRDNKVTAPDATLILQVVGGVAGKVIIQ